ncbi:MAG: CoA transferase [Flavobacteriales bacterium]|nr:CoA transferase [Flavobacteriales bacterium]
MLKDLLVVETAGVLAGPSVGMFFAELGARVVKLENAKAGGDSTRKWKLPKEDPHAKASAYFSSVNWGKEHHMVDLASEDGRKVLDTLLAKADVLITNHLAADAEKLGLERDRLRTLNPKLVHGHIKGFADDDARTAYDVVLQAETGYLSMTGTDADHLAKLPIAMIDVLAAHQLKEGLLLALLQRTKTGRGALVEVSLEEAALSALINQASNALMAGHVAKPLGTLHPNIAPYGELFTCADGVRIVLAVGTDAQFKALNTVLDTDLRNDQHFTTNAKRVLNRNVLAQLLARSISERNGQELLAALRAAKVPAGLVRPLNNVLASPAAQRMTLESMIDGVRTLRLSGNVFRIEPY